MARGLAERLKLSGFAVDIESDGASAAQTALLEPYSLIILDINLPNVSGFEVLHKIRQAGSTVPVMILTARYTVDDKVSGLDLGADDYLSKPFDISEFDARVRALVRRGQGLPNPTLICGPLAFDRAAGTITLSGRPLELRRREFAVLEVLMTRAGKLVSKERLIAEVFGFDEAGSAERGGTLCCAAFARNSVPMGRGFEPFVGWATCWRYSDRHLAAVVEANAPHQSGGARHCAGGCAWNRRHGADPAGCRDNP